MQAIIEAVYQAQREALKVPERDRTIRYIEHRPEHFHAPPDKGENYTLVEIPLFAGRSLDAIRALYQGIVKHFESLGIPEFIKAFDHYPYATKRYFFHDLRTRNYK